MKALHVPENHINLARLHFIIRFSFGWIVCTSIIPELLTGLMGIRIARPSAATLTLGIILLAGVTLFLCIKILWKSSAARFIIWGVALLLIAQFCEKMVTFGFVTVSREVAWYSLYNATVKFFNSMGLVFVGLALFQMIIEILTSRQELVAQHACLSAEMNRRKEVEHSLREREALLTGINTSALDGIILMEHGGHVRHWNPAAERILGYSATEMVGQPAHEILGLAGQHPYHGLDVPLWGPIDKGATAGKTTEARAVSKSGAEVEVELSVSSMEIFGQRHAVVILRDITQRKQAEQEYRTILQTTMDGFILFDDRGQILDVNDAYCAMSGYTREELLTMCIHDVEAAETPAETAAHIHSIRTKGGDRFETRHRRKDGAIIEIEVSANPGIPFSQHRLCAFLRDITERKRLEQERRALEAQIQYDQKLESLGVLAGGIAHDFNNILQIILGNSTMVELSIPENASSHRFIKNIQHSVNRASALTSQMLAYSGRRSGDVQIVNLRKIVDEFTPLIKSSVSKKVCLQIHHSQDVPLIEADRTQVEQVVMNLILNASESLDVKRGGLVTVSTMCIHCTEAYLKQARTLYPAPDGNYACLEVTDTGYGMSTETIEKIFEPFFTTKFTGRGLGMSAVLGIMRAHQGAILVESALGKGTTMRALFPLASGPEPPTPQDENKPLADATLEPHTILIVDDEPDVLELASEMLRQLGHTVFTATDGDQAVMFFKGHHGDIDCVLLDLSMPGLDGIQTLHKLRDLAPDIHIVLASGYTEQDIETRFRGQEIHAFLQKPYTFHSLATALDQTLGK